MGPGGGGCAERERKNCEDMRVRGSARISRIDDGPSSLCARSVPGVAPDAPINADLRMSSTSRRQAAPSGMEVEEEQEETSVEGVQGRSTRLGAPRHLALLDA
eukprot:9000527-Pyramimonas_sp.AAC.1